MDQIRETANRPGGFFTVPLVQPRRECVLRPALYKSNLPWKAFWSTAMEGKPVADVAQELSLTPGAVYIARSRVTAKLRKIVEEIDDDDAAQ